MLGSSIDNHEANKRKVKGDLLKVLMVVMVIFIGGVGLKMGVTLQEKYGPLRSAQRRRAVQEMLLESIVDKENNVAS